MNYNYFMKRVALFINGDLGKRILSYALNHHEIEVHVVLLNSSRKRSATYRREILEIQQAFNSSFILEEFNETLDFSENLINHFDECDLAISVLFGHIFPAEIIKLFRTGIVNLHPSLLPLGKGSDPVAWGILSDSKQGATIHMITEKLDSGSILSQEEIITDLGMNAGDIYQLCINSLQSQFEGVLQQLIAGNHQLRPQEVNNYKPRYSTELENLRIIRADENGSFEGFVRRIQALTYSDGRKPLFEDKQGNIWEIDVKFSQK